MDNLQKFKKVPKPAWYSLTLTFLSLSICGIIVICVFWYFANQLIYSYGIIIDAGSTSTKMFLFKWPEIASRTNGEVSEVVMCKTSPGISDFMSDPDGAYDGIEVCMNQEIIPKIPEHLRNKSFVYLGATAGMRLIEQRNPVAMKSIFQSVEKYLLSTGFKMKSLLADVKVISGSVEGIAAWITVNFLKGTLQRNVVSSTILKKKRKTYGALDLGGASTQITFVPNKTMNSTDDVIRLYGENYNVYTHSYLCYGKSQAEFRLLAFLSEKWIKDYTKTNYSRILNNPCMQKGDKASYILQDIITIPCVSGPYAKEKIGYSIDLPDYMKEERFNLTFIGSGNPNECHKVVKKLFNTSVCQYKSCGFNNVYQPKVTDRFIAFAGYFVMYKQLTKAFSGPPSGYDDFILKSKQYCKQNAPEVDPPISVKDKELDNYRKWRCFGFLYVFELLTNLGFNSVNWKFITFTNTVNEANLAWSLGYMINKTAMIPIEKPFITLSLGAFIAILLICLVIFSIGCLLAIISYKLLQQKTPISKPSENVSLKSNPYENCGEELENKV